MKIKIPVLLPILLLLFVAACSYLNQELGLEDDNFVEESAEAVIEHHTGFDVDLTPSSDEE